MRTGPRRACVVALASLVCACAVGDVEPVPLRGPVPLVVAVWPFAEGAEPPAAAAWFTGLAPALARRGYDVVPAGVTGQRLTDAGAMSFDLDAAAVGRLLDVDALLRVRVRGFDASEYRGRLRDARWDLEWELVSTRGAGRQWSYTNHGSWRRVDSVAFDPARGLADEQDSRDIVPVGGRGGPTFRDVPELVAHLHREAMRRLPMGAKP